MLTAGLDVGSRTIALVEWDGSDIVRQEVVNTGIDPLSNAKSLIGHTKYDGLVTTGYGRNLVRDKLNAHAAITEIKAYATGTFQLFSGARTVLDIGGQDCKVIKINPQGEVAAFEMNDKCAAGTGRFIENMAAAMEMDVTQIGQYALDATGEAIPLSSMCTVFAESEVVSLIGKGEDSHRVALGIHKAITQRVMMMIRRVGLQPDFVFAGGGAWNSCIKILLEQETGTTVHIPDNPQTIGALGAAIHAASLIVN